MVLRVRSEDMFNSIFGEELLFIGVFVDKNDGYFFYIRVEGEFSNLVLLSFVVL